LGGYGGDAPEAFGAAVDFVAGGGAIAGGVMLEEGAVVLDDEK